MGLFSGLLNGAPRFIAGGNIMPYVNQPQAQAGKGRVGRPSGSKSKAEKERELDPLLPNQYNEISNAYAILDNQEAMIHEELNSSALTMSTDEFQGSGFYKNAISELAMIEAERLKVDQYNNEATILKENYEKYGASIESSEVGNDIILDANNNPVIGEDNNFTTYNKYYEDVVYNQGGSLLQKVETKDQFTGKNRRN